MTMINVKCNHVLIVGWNLNSGMNSGWRNSTDLNLHQIQTLKKKKNLPLLLCAVFDKLPVSLKMLWKKGTKTKKKPWWVIAGNCRFLKSSPKRCQKRSILEFSRKGLISQWNEKIHHVCVVAKKFFLWWHMRDYLFCYCYSNPCWWRNQCRSQARSIDPWRRFHRWLFHYSYCPGTPVLLRLRRSVSSTLDTRPQEWYLE